MTTRRELDKYFTADAITRAFLTAYLPLNRVADRSFRRKTGLICEPCVGAGAMFVAISKHLPWATIVTNDISPDASFPPDTLLDAKKTETYQKLHQAATDREWGDGPIQWVITNPPFGEAFEILKASYDAVEVGVAMLLRLSFLEPTIGRAEWLQTHRPNALYILGSPRPSYTGDGNNDSVTSAWMVWLKKDHPLGKSMAKSLSLNGIHFLTNKSKVWGQ